MVDARWLSDRLGPLLERPFAGLGLRVGALLGVYAVLEWWTLGLGRLPASSYWSTSILIEWLHRTFVPGRSPSLGTLLRMGVTVVLLIVLATRPRRFLRRWGEIDQGSVLRVVIGVAALVLGWAYSTYAYNYAFAQTHMADRLALVALAILTIWRPLFALPTALAVVAIVGQFFEPLGGYSVAEQFMLVRVLLLFTAYALVRAFWSEVHPSDLIFLILTLVASGYAVSGLGKIQLGWFSHGRIALLLPGAYTSGWLGFLEPETIGSITRTLLRLDVVMLVGAFVVEGLAFFALTSRRVLLFFLLSWIGFHLAIAALSGIFFWKWILLLSTLGGLLVVRRQAEALSVFSRPHALWSVPLILGGTLWFHPVNLSWYSVPLSYGYHFEAVGASGERYHISPAEFAPYDYQFALGGFGYLSPFRQLLGQWGARSFRETVEEVVAARHPADVDRLVEQRGRSFEDPPRVAVMGRFMQRYVESLRDDDRRTGLRALRLLRSPPQILRPTGAPSYQGQEEIESIEVRQVTGFFDGVQYVELYPRIIRTFDVRVSRRP